MTRIPPDNIIGIDVGGVIIDKDKNDDSDTSLFGPNYLQAKPVECAFAALRSLNKITFKDRVWIVSKCGANIEQRTREWMEHNQFHETTGIPKERLRFCRDRSGKAPIAREIGLTHFVDDKLEVLNYMKGAVAHRMLFRPHGSEIDKNRTFWSNGVMLWSDWPSLMAWLEAEDAKLPERKAGAENV